MAITDIWMATARQTWGAGGEPMLNNYFYTSVDAGANAAGLAVAMLAEGGVLDASNDLQVNHVKNVSLRVINLGSLTDFTEEVWEGQGSYGSGDALPIHSAVNFTLKLNTRAVRNGSKRYSGIPEAVQSQGIITDATYIGYVDTMQIALSDSQTDGTHDYNPVVVKRIFVAAVPGVSKDHYRLPETTGELVFGNVVAVLSSNQVSHQVSRGNGR